jgi:hypothetical protein
MKSEYSPEIRYPVACIIATTEAEMESRADTTGEMKEGKRQVLKRD